MIILYYKSDESDWLKITDPDVAVDRLYYLEARFPREEQVRLYIEKHPQNEITKFFDKGIERGLRRIKRELSRLDAKIPLYDVFSENLYLIGKFNVYDRVVHQHYRFPTSDFYRRLRVQAKELRAGQGIGPDPLEKRKYRKLLLMITFLRAFDLDILFRTYIRVFYLYANDVGKNITTCRRPSFLPHFTHLQPYYTRADVINLALNMGIKLEERYYEPHDIERLCPLVSVNDISADILLRHQRYMISKSKVGLVQYYTLQGSYFINQYLREQTPYKFRNDLLERVITPMWELLNQAPPFDRPYTLYRFVSNDDYLKHLNVGDMYTEPGFMSTTRDPFYRSDLYKFGFILIKIKIPGAVKGVALCVETISHFPTEQEILLCPLSTFRLDRRNEKIEYYHTDENFRSMIKTLYEFTYIGSHGPRYPQRVAYDEARGAVDFLRIENVDTGTLEEKIRFFVAKYCNPMFQFEVKIGDNVYGVIAERFDSTGAYSKFYAVSTKNGFSLYTLHNNYMLFMVELSEDSGLRQMHVNYYVKYSALDRAHLIGDENFMKFVSSIAYYFGIDRVVVWADYRACDLAMGTVNGPVTGPVPGTGPGPGPTLPIQRGGIQRGFAGSAGPAGPAGPRGPMGHPEIGTGSDIDNQKVPDAKYMGGSYCLDFYTYLKTGTTRYSGSNILTLELQPRFSYHQLEKLRTADRDTILRKDDQDELFQIYDKVYRPGSPSPNVADFYVWVAENRCYLMDTLVGKMERFFRVENPFLADYYILDPITFLYNRRYLQTYPRFVTRGEPIVKSSNKGLSLPKNEYRQVEAKIY